MKVKFGLVAGVVAACAVITGCKAPKAQSQVRTSRSVQAAAEPAPAARPAPAPAPAPVAKPAPAPVVKPAPEVKPAEPEYTEYRIKGGDILSAICATYGIRQAKVLELNPGMDPDKLFVGRKIKLPGKIDLKDADAKSLAKPAAKKSVKKAAKAKSSRVSSYSGATKVYVVKNGDSLGKIAYSNGITIKCLKDMNGLKNNVIRIGQKLKIPATKPVAKKAATATVKAEEKKPVEKKAESAVTPPESDSAAPVTHTVKEGEDTVSTATVKDEEEKPVEKKDEEEKPVEKKEPLVSPPEPAPAVPVTHHTVKAGEDTVSIAIDYGVSPSVVMDLNNLQHTDTLTPGQVLKLPANAVRQQ